MSRRSSIETDPVIRAEVDAAIVRGATFDEIVAHLRSMGSNVSRSAVGRYSKGYAEMAAQQRDMQSVAKAFANDFGSADDKQGRMMIQLVTSMITRSVLPDAMGEEVERTGKDLADLARAVKDVTSASKIDVEREARIREEAARRARQEAASAAETALKTAGASDDTMRKVRMQILGLSA